MKFEPRTLVVLDHRGSQLLTFSSQTWESEDYKDVEDFLVKKGYNLNDVKWMITDSYYG